MTIRKHWVRTIRARWPRLVVAGLAAAVSLPAAKHTRPGAPAASKRAASKPAASQPPASHSSASQSGELAALVRVYRETPSPERRAAVERYAAAHANDIGGSLAQLALGVVAYEQKDYPAAIAFLHSLAARLPQIALQPFVGSWRIPVRGAVGCSRRALSNRQMRLRPCACCAITMPHFRSRSVT